MTELYVQAMKYNGDKHFSYPSQMISQDPEVITVYGPPGRRLLHPGRGLDMSMENMTIDFFFPGRYYNVFAGFNLDGSFRHYYCNLCLPPELDAGQLTWVDMDLDLVVRPDLTYVVDDEDEFAERTIAWSYPPELVQTLRSALEELIALVESRSFPFDGTAQRLLCEIRG